MDLSDPDAGWRESRTTWLRFFLEITNSGLRKLPAHRSFSKSTSCRRAVIGSRVRSCRIRILCNIHASGGHDRAWHLQILHREAYLFFLWPNLHHTDVYGLSLPLIRLVSTIQRAPIPFMSVDGLAWMTRLDDDNICPNTHCVALTTTDTSENRLKMRGVGWLLED